MDSSWPHRWSGHFVLTAHKGAAPGRRGAWMIKSLFLTEGTGLHIHILGQHQLFQLGNLPLQIFHILCRDRDQKIEIVEVLVVPQTVFQKYPLRMAPSRSSKSVLVSLVSRILLRLIRSCCPSFRTMRSLGWRVKNRSMSIPSPALTRRLSHPAGTVFYSQ